MVSEEVEDAKNITNVELRLPLAQEDWLLRAVCVRLTLSNIDSGDSKLGGRCTFVHLRLHHQWGEADLNNEYQSIISSSSDDDSRVPEGSVSMDCAQGLIQDITPLATSAVKRDPILDELQVETKNDFISICILFRLGVRLCSR